MALTPYQRRTERARELGYPSYYYRRRERVKEALGEKLIDTQMAIALQYRRELGLSIKKAAKEAHVASERLSAIEQQYGVTERIKGPILMLSYTRKYGMVYVDLDETNASLNGSYLNYCRWMIYREDEEILKRRDYSDSDELVKFNNMLRGRGIKDQSFHAINVYHVSSQYDYLVMDPEPFDSDIDLQWDYRVHEIEEYDLMTTDDKLPLYARR